MTLTVIFRSEPLALLDGWPNIPQLLQRHSWDTSKTISPSVRQAVAHLELLQDIIEEWYTEAEVRIASRNTSGKSAGSEGDASSGIMQTLVELKSWIRNSSRIYLVLLKLV